MSVDRGECLFLVGPSGCGKSTLLSLIGCLLDPDDGQVFIDGIDIASYTSDERARFRSEKIGFVFQQHHLIRSLSALDNVCLPLVLSGKLSAGSTRRASELLMAVGLQDKIDARPHELSMGQCQRVALARALVANPPLILADEPTASLDAHSGRAAIELIVRLVKEFGKTAIVVTHDQRILQFADRILELGNNDRPTPESASTYPVLAHSIKGATCFG